MFPIYIDNAAPNERKSANATVVMNLIDENDNVPMFTKRYELYKCLYP